MHTSHTADVLIVGEAKLKGHTMATILFWVLERKCLTWERQYQETVIWWHNWFLVGKSRAVVFCKFKEITYMFSILRTLTVAFPNSSQTTTTLYSVVFDSWFTTHFLRPILFARCCLTYEYYTSELWTIKTPIHHIS
mgnify:CR=1 FL=1